MKNVSGRLLLIRADGGPNIGCGHVMRCLALAQAWQDAGGQVRYISAGLSTSLTARLSREKIASTLMPDPSGSLADAAHTGALARDCEADWLVIDGYQFGSDYQHTLTVSGARMLLINDGGNAEEYLADAVLDQNLGASESAYVRRRASTRLLLGPRFALLRREFARWRGWRREVPEKGRRVLVTLGGADPDNATLKVLEALANVDVEVVAVIGPANAHGDILEKFAGQAGGRIRLQRNATDMPELMAWADLAVSAAGATCWELAFMGLPSLLIVLAENQRASAGKLHETGASKNLGWHHALDAMAIRAEILKLLHDREMRSAMSARASQIVDGKGSSRVVLEMKSHQFTVRPVRNEDCRRIFEWANEPAARRASFSSEPIPWEAHVGWFAKKLGDPRCAFYLVSDAQQIPVAQVRFDIEDRKATISVNVEVGARGHGTGSAVIFAACREFLKTHPAEQVNAYIKPDNEASRRAFLRAGFEEFAPLARAGQAVAHLVLCGGGQ